MVAGYVYESAARRLVFRYDEEWRRQSGAYPLSLSLPLRLAEHGHRAIHAYLWGLLPENPAIIESWARRYGVSPYRVVDLVAEVGEDCAGAVQLVKPERVDVFSGPSTTADESSSVRWLSEGEIESRLTELRLDPASARIAGDTGQFSLAGAQPKTALYQSATGRWGVPSERMPTNRILKIPIAGLEDIAYNEHFCLLLARELGLPTVTSAVLTFGKQSVVMLERYDRLRVGNAVIRVHQEDTCQALAVQPTRKYETDGGPSAADIAALLVRHAYDPESDLIRFVDSLVLNWLIAGTDAHAKNYSLLHAFGPQLRLAPLYDLISILPYKRFTKQPAALAMSIGGERRIPMITWSHWQKLAEDIGLPEAAVRQRIDRMVSAIPGAIARVQSSHGGQQHTAAAFARIGAHVVDHARACAGLLR